MKTILCYGDSNTWGYNARDESRFPLSMRWTGVAQAALGNGYRLIEEGCNGRTTVWDDPLEMHKNGRIYLSPCLESHRPLDLVLIMLGTNDLKARFNLLPMDIALGAAELVKLAQSYGCGPGGAAPRVLLVSPIRVGDFIEETESVDYFGGREVAEKSQKLAPLYARMAERCACHYVDAAQFAQPCRLDAVHLDEDGHRALGLALAQVMRQILG